MNPEGGANVALKVETPAEEDEVPTPTPNTDSNLLDDSLGELSSPEDVGHSPSPPPPASPLPKQKATVETTEHGKIYLCPECPNRTIFTTTGNLSRHGRQKHGWKKRSRPSKDVDKEAKKGKDESPKGNYMHALH